MKPFQPVDTVVVPITQPNFDTDQIIPSRYLQKLRDNDFGVFLFRDQRFRPDGSENPDFVINQPAYRQGKVIVAERNFACGSSREHAVWALCDHGFRAVIACLVPRSAGVIYEHLRREALWDRYCTEAPARRRQCVERYHIVKRA
jgi:3-isopropylmalate dehydratase small subunit